MKSSFNELGDECHAIAKSKGFWGGKVPTRLIPHDSIVTKLALISCEVSEAIEYLRERGSPDQEFAIELIDIIIRTLDLGRGLELDLDAAFMYKYKKNKNRPKLHGKLF